MIRISNVFGLVVGFAILVLGLGGLVSFLLQGDVVSGVVISIGFIGLGLWVTGSSLRNWRSRVGVVEATVAPASIKVVAVAVFAAICIFCVLSIGAYLVNFQVIFRASYYSMLLSFLGIPVVLIWYISWRLATHLGALPKNMRIQSGDSDDS